MNRAQVAQLYRPVGPKPVVLGQSITPGTGGTTNLNGQVDLSVPIRGLRFVVKGRLVIGTADFSSVTPEGLLGILSNMRVTGTNARQKGNVTLYDLDLATIWTIQHMFDLRSGMFEMNANEVPFPTTPWPAASTVGYSVVTQGTYDFRIVVDLPFHPFAATGIVVPQFLMREEEWKDSVQISFQTGTQAGAGATGFYGTAAGGSTATWTAFGSGAGTPTVDVYSLPIIMGSLADGVLPGFMTRVQTPISTVLQNAGTGVTLLQLQKQPTSRIFAKFGTSTLPNGNPAFATLSDTNVTQLGLIVGANRSVRNKADVFAHKQTLVDIYPRPPIQGYNCFDFIASGNPDASYPGNLVGDGATFNLTGDVTGVANAYGILVQEMIPFAGTGPLYSF